jgi:hypothetical protein
MAQAISKRHDQKYFKRRLEALQGTSWKGRKWSLITLHPTGLLEIILILRLVLEVNCRIDLRRHSWKKLAMGLWARMRQGNLSLSMGYRSSCKAAL